MNCCACGFAFVLLSQNQCFFISPEPVGAFKWSVWESDLEQMLLCTGWQLVV